MTRPTVVGIWGNNALSTSVAITIPNGGVQVGDTLVIVAARDTTGSDTITWNESGWDETGLGNLNFTNGNAKAAFRLAVAADADGAVYTINGATSRGLCGLILAVRGDPSTPIAVASGSTQAASTTSTPPSRIIAANDSLYVALAAYTAAYGVLTPPADHTVQGEYSYTGAQDCYVWASSFDADTADSPVASSYTHTNNVLKALYSLVFSPYTASGSTTISPVTGIVTSQGLAPSINPFASITLRGTLINEAGSPVADATGISCLVWYSNAPAGPPDQSLSALTTNANGSYSFALALGGLSYLDPVYRVIVRGDPPTQNHAGRRIPAYEV